MDGFKDRVLLAADAIASSIGSHFGKKHAYRTNDLEQKLLRDLAQLYNLTYYTPMTRINEIAPSPFLIKSITRCNEGECGVFSKLQEWSREAGISADIRNPFDLVRTLLDSSLEACIGITALFKDSFSSAVNKLETSIGTISLAGYCDALRGVSELSATQFQHHYLFHLERTVEDLYQRFSKKGQKLDVRRILGLDKEELEKFRVYVTSKFQPSVKAFLSQAILLKYHWPIASFLERMDGRQYVGFQGKKPLEPTYLGRILSELIDALQHMYYDETVLVAFDKIVNYYFSVFRGFSESVKNLEEVGYIEHHPALNRMYTGLEGILDDVTPQASAYLKRRGMVRLGEVKQDVKDYLLTILYLENEYSRSYATQGLSPNIRSYDLFKLIHSNRLVIK